MNFSKGLLLIFSLIALIFQLLIIKDIPSVNGMYFYILLVSSILAFLFNLYFTYNIKYHDDKKDKDDNSE
jgi:hypothetical protein